MSRDQQRLQDYLAHILQSIEPIDRYCEDLSELDFLQNKLVQDAVIRNFEVVGEACNNIEKHYADFAEALPNCRFPVPTKCVTLLHMATSRWITN